jgi:hypothetical protein
VETYENKNSLFTGFPAHAEIGAMIFMALWSHDMDGIISKQDYMTVAQAILRHMCGYHGNDCEGNLYKRALLKAESCEVLELLGINRVGDHYGKLANYTLDQTTKFLEEQKKFEDHITREEKFDLPSLLTTYTNKSGAINPSKLVIYLIGRSGAGKTYLLGQIMERFPNMVSAVSRDECIAQVCVGVNERLESPAYPVMYQIYEAGKLVSSFIRKLASGKKLDKRELNQFAEAKVALSKAQEAWNAFTATSENPYPKVIVFSDSDPAIPNISGDVQALYMSRMKQFLMDPRKPIIVLDTVMNLYPMAVMDP